MIEACYLYCYAIKILIHNPENAKLAYESTKNRAKERGIIKSWFDDIERGKLPPARPHCGRCIIAFSYSFHYLKKATKFYDKKTFYTECIKDVLLKGGDTDTNAAIVGGLIGALVGL